MSAQLISFSGHSSYALAGDTILASESDKGTEQETLALKLWSMHKDIFKNLNFGDLSSIVEYASSVQATEQVQDLSTKTTQLVRSLYVFPDGTVIIQLNKAKAQDKIIGRGTYSTVKYGIDLKRQKVVAIITSTGRGLERSKEGYEAAQKVSGAAGVATVRYQFDAKSKGWKGDKFVVIMDYIRGMTLEELMKGSAINQETSARQAAKLCRALEAFHTKQVAHADIKPQNIMIDEDMNPILIDFGVAAPLNVKGLATDRDEGTPAYLPSQRRLANPEWKEAVICDKDDIFALGLVFWKLWKEEVKTYLVDSPFPETFCKFLWGPQGDARAYELTKEANWMLKEEFTLDGLYEKAAAGDTTAAKAYLIGWMCAAERKDRPDAGQARKFIESHLLSGGGASAADGGLDRE